MLVPGVNANVKIRSGTATVKIKELVEHEDDGFELWRTSIDAPLPASRETWDAIARVLSVRIDTAHVAPASEPGEALDALRGSASAVRDVEVMKERTSFAADAAQVEVADVTVGGTRLQSIAFESTDLAAARSLRSRLGGRELGSPENYVDLCRRILAATGV